MEGEAEAGGGGGERETLECGLEGEKVMVGSEMKPCFIIVETWRDFKMLSAAIEEERNAVRKRMVQTEAMEGLSRELVEREREDGIQESGEEIDEAGGLDLPVPSLTLPFVPVSVSVGLKRSTCFTHHYSFTLFFNTFQL